MISYILNTIILSGLLLLIYIVLLYNKKCHIWNRLFLLCTLFISAILPLFDLAHIQTVHTEVYAIPTIKYLKGVTIYKIQNLINSYDTIVLTLSILYLLGGVAMIIRFAAGLFTLSKIKSIATKMNIDNYNVYFSKEINTPFSFCNTIYMPSDFLEDKQLLQNVLLHEKAHLHYMHSIDKILCVLFEIIFWFNPFIKIIHKQLELIHEYQADSVAVKNAHKDNYVETILYNIKSDKQPIYITNTFFHHSLKNRITMLYLKNKKNTLNRILSLVATLCVLFIFIHTNSFAQGKKVSVNKPNYTLYQPPADTIEIVGENGKTDTVIVVNKNVDTVYESVDVSPEFMGGDDALFKYIATNLKYPAKDKESNRNGKVVIQFIVNARGRIYDAKILKNTGSEEMGKEALKVIRNMPDWQPGMKDGKPVSVTFVIPITFSIK